MSKGAWAKEVAMWEGIVEGELPLVGPDGPWATAAERRQRVELLALSIALRLTLAPAEVAVADRLERGAR